MADRLFEAMSGGSPMSGGSGLLRLIRSPRSGDRSRHLPAAYPNTLGREAQSHGDLGVLLAQEIAAASSAGDPSWSARAKASAPPSSAPRNTPRR
jgi:hypothetical protein